MRAEEGCLIVGECAKYLKRRWGRKERTRSKNFEKGDKLGQGVGALKKGGSNSITNYGFSIAYRKFAQVEFGNTTSC